MLSYFGNENNVIYPQMSSYPYLFRTWNLWMEYRETESILAILEEHIDIFKCI